jgi:hypothetical protein
MVLALLAPGAPAVPPDLDTMLERVREVQSADLAAWREFDFRRSVRRERLDDKGRVREREEWEFLVRPIQGGFDEELLRIDGRQPTRREVKHHRNKARFTKHYGKASEGGDDGLDEGGGYPLMELLGRSVYHYEGREWVDGVACHRLSFDAETGAEGKGVERRLMGAMVGTLWVTEEGLHVLRARARSAHGVNLPLGAGEISLLEIQYDNGPVTPEVWLPERIEVHSVGRIIFSKFHKRNLYLYSGFTPVAGLVPAGGE